ncbi:MAG: GNAT family N-acetyltransferase [Halobacteriaceae archaeon]
MVEIRRARMDERDAISAVHATAVQNVPPIAYDEKELAAWEASLSSVSYAIDEGKSLFLVAEEETNIIGFGEARLDETELVKLYVHPEHQDQGVATRLLERIETGLRSRGADSVYVESSVNAAPFYERNGFDRIGTHQKTIASDKTTVEMLVIDMVKSL